MVTSTSVTAEFITAKKQSSIYQPMNKERRELSLESIWREVEDMWKVKYARHQKAHLTSLTMWSLKKLPSGTGEVAVKVFAALAEAWSSGPSTHMVGS